MIFDIILILGLIILNGFFALSEIAIVTAKKERLERLANDGNKKAGIAAQLAGNPDQFLSSIQVGITLISIIVGAIAAANLTQPVYEWFQKIHFLSGYSWEIAYVIVVGVVTYITLIIGELVPKRLAINNPERLAVRVARPMRFVSKIASPLVWVLSRSMRGILTLIGSSKNPDEPSVTTREIRGMMAEGIKEGTVEKEEHEIVTRLFQFGDQDVAAVMTPRPEISGIDLEADKEEQKQKLLNLNHTRAVAYRKNMDEAVGVIHVREVLDRLLRNEDFELEESVRDVRFIPENASALQVLKHFRETGEKMTIIIDEYGGVDGLVTLDDILEALIGDIPWVGESPLDADVKKLNESTWVIEGKVTIEHFQDLLSLPDLSDEKNYRTVGGWIINHFDQIPEEGAHFKRDEYLFEVLSMDNSRVEKIKVTLLDDETSDEEE